MIRTSIALALLAAPPALAGDPRPVRPATPLSIPQAPAEDVVFAQAEEALKAFEQIRLPDAKGLTMVQWSTGLQSSMSALSKGMADLQQRYSGLASTASPTYAIPALVRVGEVMERFAAELEGMSLHPDLPIEAQDQLRKAISQGADGIRVAARGSYQQAVQRAEQVGFKGEWLDFARQALQRLPDGVKAP